MLTKIIIINPKKELPEFILKSKNDCSFDIKSDIKVTNKIINCPSESWGFRVSLRMSGHDETQKFRRKWRVIMPCSLLIKGKYSDKKVEIILNKG